MKRLLTTLLIVTTIIITGCVDKTPLSDDNKIYAGKWISNDGTWIHIYNNGSGSFEQSNSNVKGGATVITDSTIEIRFMGIGATFSIDKSPYEENGELKMQLDGNSYVKQ